MNRKTKLIITSLLGLLIAVGLARYFSSVNIPVLEPKGVVGLGERSLLITAVLLAAVVVIPLFVMLGFIAWKYREGNPRRTKYNPEFDHSFSLEAVWWLVPTAIILVLSIITWHSSYSLSPSKALASSQKPIVIQVIAMDWKWLFIYPGQNIASVNFVQFPVNRPVDFQITSDAPMNSFWIPQLGGQIYAMPGMSTELHLSANQIGSYNGSSANISGKGFAGMTFTARASSASDFNGWVDEAKASANQLNLGTYNKLGKPSSSNPIAYYSSAETGLYNYEVMKYIMPNARIVNQPPNAIPAKTKLGNNYETPTRSTGMSNMNPPESM